MFNPNSDTYRYVENKMMLEKNEEWDTSGDNGIGDALWRTSLSYVAYKDPSLKEAILSCFRKFTMINKDGKHWYQGSRSADRFREDDVSRDQTILALSALKENGDLDELEEIGLHLPYELSRRFKMMPTMWIWIRAIVTKKKIWTFLFQTLELLEFLPSVLWDKILRKIMGWDTEYSQEWYLGVDTTIPFWSNEDGEWVYIEEGWDWVNNGQRLHNNHQHKRDVNFIYNFMCQLEYPEYALHLTSWMVYSSEDTFMKRILQRLGIWMAEKDNLLVRKLMGKEITQEEIDEYQPTRGYRWSSRYNGTSYTNYVEGDDAIYNILDKDIL